MAKDKSLKLIPPKGKKSRGNEAEEPTETKIKKKKRRHVEVEEAPVQNPGATIPDEETPRKDKKRKKTKVTELPHPGSGPGGTQEPEGEGDQALTPEERRVLERKLKKIRKKEEKKRLKADGQTKLNTQEAGPSASKLALEYLSCWAERRSAWKFQKSRQTWLLQHMYDSEKIPDDTFVVLLQYLEGLFGSAKETTVVKALELVEESGKAPEDVVVQQRAQRAREVIQLLS
uniref:Zmp:0000000624 n=1 Tax=Fundulus heteroclitus TaxID=8078 RepID=A0A3Q2UR57_FUNHE